MNYTINDIVYFWRNPLDKVWVGSFIAMPANTNTLCKLRHSHYFVDHRNL